MFWIRYKELCEMVGKSANAAAKEMRISSGTITNWKKGTNPQDDNLATVANYFMVSEGYLTGITDVLGTKVAYRVAPNDLPNHVKEAIAKNIFLLLSKSGKYRRDIGDEAEVEDAMTKLILPNLNTLEIWASNLGVTLEELFGGWSYLLRDDRRNSPALRVALFGGDGNVTEAMWNEVLDFAQFVKSREDARK